MISHLEGGGVWQFFFLIEKRKECEKRGGVVKNLKKSVRSYFNASL